MNTFKITQIQDDANIFLYPNGDLSSCTQFTAYGDSPNYKCVDEDYLNCDEDSSYVYWNKTSVATDIYTLTQISELEDINYIQVFTNVKSNFIKQANDGVYKILLNVDSVCGNTYKSDNINLSTDYNLYSYSWITNPATGDSWTLDSINSLNVGIETSSPTTLGYFNTTIRPNDTGTYTDCRTESQTPNYKSVDEITADDDTTYNWTYVNKTQIDTVNIENHTNESGIIDNIAIYIRAKYADGTSGTITPMAFIDGTLDYETDYSLTSSYANYSDSLETNPHTGNAWTWNEIDRLQIGYKVFSSDGNVRVTQLYAVVTYITTDNKTLVLRPNGDHTINLTPVPTPDNYANVDEVLTDEDSTYNWNSGGGDYGDTFTHNSHTTESGTITDVECVIRAKRIIADNEWIESLVEFNAANNQYSQYAVDGSGSSLLKDDYDNYTYTWTTNPDIGAAWTWSDIDDFRIGYFVSNTSTDSVRVTQLYYIVHYSTNTTHTLTLRPNVEGDYSECNVYPKIGDNWAEVDEVLADDDDTYNESTVTFAINDTFNIPDTSETGDITKVTLVARAKNYGLMRLITLAGRTLYYSDNKYTDIHYKNYTYGWETNPDTGLAWTWNDIDNLEIGYELTGKIDVTQLYIYVEYTKNYNPEIRTTQEYVKINYTNTTTCDLLQPEEISTNHARNIKMLNFWNGDREVYDLSRRGKTTVFTGQLFDRTINSIWFDSDYYYRKKIIIDHTQVNSSLADFPVYIEIDLENKCLNSDGYDVAFYDSSGTTLSFEIEEYKYPTGILRVWVKLPVINNSEDTIFYIYYRKENVTINPSSTDTWSNGYVMVQHMTNNPDTSHIKDSTSYGNDGTKCIINEPKEQKGILVKDQYGNGINDYIIMADNDTLDFPNTDSGTISFWVKTDIIQKRDIIIKSYWSGAVYYWWLIRQGIGTASWKLWTQWQSNDGTANNNWSTPDWGDLSDKKWHYITVIINRDGIGNDVLRSYFDGNFEANASTKTGNPNTTNNQPLYLFKGVLSAGRFKGNLDEIHINKTVKNDDWIAAEYANQKENSTFLLYGKQEYDYSINAEDTIICMRNMTRNGAVISTSNLIPTYFNKDYRIRQFGWKKINKKLEHYNWILELEDAD